MTDIALATVTFEGATGLPKDRVVNTFSVVTSDNRNIVASDAAVVGARLQTFYDGVAAGGRIADYLSPAVLRTPKPTVRLYDIGNHLDGSPHGSPIGAFSFTALSAAGDPSRFDLPREVALCLTLRGQLWDELPIEVPDDADPDNVPQRPRQRASGRIYLGPLRGIAGSTDAGSGDIRPAAAFRATVEASAVALAGNLNTDGFAWVVWSRANAAITVIEAFQTDDAFDTQRRRGSSPTVRTTSTHP